VFARTLARQRGRQRAGRDRSAWTIAASLRRGDRQPPLDGSCSAQAFIDNM
jgi:hypothetical protein